jgi:surfactin synthase thioesterase subunit
LKSEILVSVPGEEDKPAEDRAAIHAKTVEEAMGAILDTLDDFPVEVWGEALGGAVASLLQSKLDAEGIAEEEKATEG